MMRVSDPDHYHQRNRVETVFAILKRRLEEFLEAGKYRLRVKEININVILSNLLRLMTSFSVLIGREEFSKA